MKKLLPITLLLTLFFAFALFTPQADASGGVVKVVNAKSAVVRAEANGSSNKLLTLSKGYYVTQISSSNGWAKVKAGKTTGYMKMDTLKVKNFSRKVLNARTEVKQTASKNALTLTALQKNTVVENYGSAGNGWSYVKVGNTSGYVPTKNLKAPGSAIKYLTAGASMYELPNASGDYIGYIDAYTKVSVLSTVGNYSYVKTGSKYGYIYNSNLVQQMAFAKTYLPKCANVKTKEIKCKTNEYGGPFIYKNEPFMADDFLGSYFVDGDNLVVGWYEGRDIVDFPLYKGKSWSYEAYVDSYVYAKAVSVNETVRYKGKTLKNVIKIENYLPGYGTYYSYVAPGYGFIAVN